jgi:hypothetical protein
LPVAGLVKPEREREREREVRGPQTNGTVFTDAKSHENQKKKKTKTRPSVRGLIVFSSFVSQPLTHSRLLEAHSSHPPR